MEDGRQAAQHRIGRRNHNPAPETYQQNVHDQAAVRGEDEPVFCL
jgi:hypothetical protein